MMTELTRRSFLKGMIAAAGLAVVGVEFEQAAAKIVDVATVPATINGGQYDVVMMDVRNEVDLIPYSFGDPWQSYVPRIIGTTIMLTVRGHCNDQALLYGGAVPFSIPFGGYVFSGDAICAGWGQRANPFGDVETNIDLKLTAPLQYSQA